MNANQLEVVKWWHLGREYQKGVALLARFCRNKVLINTLMRKTERYGRGKLEYQLPKAVKLNFRKMPELPELPELPIDIESSDAKELPKVNEGKVSGDGIVEDSVENIVVVIPLSGKTKIPIISDKPLGQYPKVIRRLKYEYSELYKARGINHKNMTAVPELNTPDNNKLRSGYLQQMKDISLRMDFLYMHIKEYEDKNIIPAENIIWPVVVTEPEPELESVKQLTHKRSLLLNGNYKDNNQLRFQQIKKADKDNPMPDGPKKEKIKLRVKKRESEILAIDNKLIEIEKRDAGTSE
jgi:hypothetical protein